MVSQRYMLPTKLIGVVTAALLLMGSVFGTCGPDGKETASK